MIDERILFLVAVGVSAVAAWTDWRTGHIPNWLTFGALIVAPGMHAGIAGLLGGGASEALQAAGISLLGAVACGLMPLLLFRRGAIGGGDVKLFAAVGALCRPVVGFHAETYAFVVGLVFALVLVGRQGKLGATFENVAAMLKLSPRKVEGAAAAEPVPFERMTSLRFAPSIFAGVCIATALQWRAA